MILKSHPFLMHELEWQCYFLLRVLYKHHSQQSALSVVIPTCYFGRLTVVFL